MIPQQQQQQSSVQLSGRAPDPLIPGLIGISNVGNDHTTPALTDLGTGSGMYLLSGTALYSGTAQDPGAVQQPTSFDPLSAPAQTQTQTPVMWFRGSDVPMMDASDSDSGLFSNHGGLYSVDNCHN
jgi:hypothetical protein